MSESLPSQSEYWDDATPRESEWVEITGVEPILIPAALRRKLEKASKREGMPADDLATD